VKSSKTTLHYVIQKDGARDLVLLPLVRYKAGHTAEWTMKYGLNYAWTRLINASLNLQLD